MIHVGDNTWNLRVMITDLQVEKTLRVKGDLHIGGVMLKLSKTEGESPRLQRLSLLSLHVVISESVPWTKFIPFLSKQRVSRRKKTKKSLNS